MWQPLRTITGQLWGVSALWLLALALCLTGWTLLSGSSGPRQSDRVTRAAIAASVELAPGLLRPNTSNLAPLVRALLARQDVGFAWLRVRDSQGHALAAAGLLDSSGSGLLASSGLRRQIYSLISTEHQAPIVHEGREVGTLEFGLLIGGGGFGGAGGRLGLGLLALLVGVPSLLLLSLRLKNAFLTDWSQGSRKAADVATLRESIRQPVTPTAPAISPAAGELMAVFDRGGIVIDRAQCVRDLNDQAEQLTGWKREQALGQDLSTVLVLAPVDPQGPSSLQLDECLRGMHKRVQGHFTLLARNNMQYEVEIDAGPIRDAAGRIGGALLSLRKVEKTTGALQQVVPASALAPAQDPRQLSQMLLDQVLECVITTDSQDRIQFANGRALQNFGYDLTELRGEHISRLLPVPFLRNSQMRVADFLVVLPEMPTAEVTARRRDGSQYRAVLVVHPVDFRGRQGHVITVRPTEARAQGGAIGHQLRQLLESSPQEVYVADVDSLQLIAANEHALSNLGFTTDQLAQMTLLRLCPRLAPETLREQVSQLREGVADMLEYRSWQQRANGSSYEVQVRLSLWRGEGPTVLLLMAQDVSTAALRPDTTLREGKLDFLGYHDALTGLPSRPLFMERMQKALARSEHDQRPFVVVHLALSDFSEVNQEYGYESGDVLLKAVADRLSTTVGTEDTVARLGGDEFTLLLMGAAQRPLDVASRLKPLQQALSQPLRMGMHEISLKACMGATVYPEDSATPDLLLRHAGLALREARGKGPGHASLYRVSTAAAGIKQEVAQPDELLSEAQTRGQLGFEMQALNDVRARLVVGAEVLLAWRYPGRGLLRSAEQVQQASGNSALTGALSTWVLKRACEQQAQWRDMELKILPLLVNLSALPLAGRREAQAVRGLLARHRVPPEQLIVMVNASGLEALLVEEESWLPVLRDLGLRLGVNDVDPARIDLLRRADVDLVQLTPRNIAGLPNAREAAEETAKIVEVAQRLGAHLFASGVERAAQREALLALGCYFQQGRLFGEPLGPREFSRSLLRAEVSSL